MAATTRPIIRRLRDRRTLAACASTSALALGVALTAAAPAAAAPAAPAPKPVKVTHPGADHMGSTIPAHEKTQHVAYSQVAPSLAASVPGMDVSGYQGSVNWSTAWKNGGRFAYVKATESTNYRNPSFSQQYDGSYKVGMIRGAYHFAVPSNSGGATQADYFVKHGGGWSKDGKTLPPMLDIEYNPYGSSCYGLSQASMVSWIKAFSDEVHKKTGRWVTIYTTNDWWKTCTGNKGDFSKTNPLFIARYASSAGTLPPKWGFYTFWQYADSGKFPGDQDVFNGSLDRLKALANG